MSNPDESTSIEISIVPIEIGHPAGFGGHEFEYQSSDDLFQCWRCGGYEVSLRDHSTGEIRPCPGPTGAEEKGGISRG